MPEPSATTCTERAWDWRKADGGCIPQGRRIFHAYDVNDNAACAPSYGLVASCEEPNEGSEFCHDCMDVVRVTPEGRERRRPAHFGRGSDHG